MSQDLGEAIENTAQQFRATPEDARAVFNSISILREGLRSDVSIREHAIVVDEPEQLGGTDAGPNPIELILAALGACQEITYKAYATAMGIELRSVSVKLAGDIDLRGFFGVDDAVRPGFDRIRGEVRIDSDAAPEDIERLKETVDAHCPVLDMLSTPVPIEMALKDRGSA